jgi:hypothetical protein
MSIAATVLELAPDSIPAPQVPLPDVVDALASLVGSAEPAVVFLSVMQVCVPRICVSAAAAIAEAGERTYTVVSPRSPNVRSAVSRPLDPHRVLAFGGIEVAPDSVVTEIHGPATSSHSSYEGVLVLTFARPGPTDALLGQLVADRAVSLIALERLQELAETRRVQVDNLTIALRSNRDIGIALGVIMSRYRVSEDGAFDLLRTSSQDTQRKVRDLAVDVVRTGQLESCERQPARRDGRTASSMVGALDRRTPC